MTAHRVQTLSTLLCLFEQSNNQQSNQWRKFGARLPVWPTLSVNGMVPFQLVPYLPLNGEL